MDYEKKYKEALERARKAYNAIPPESRGARKIIEDAFPQLRESEDERIRKWILEKVQGYATSGICMAGRLEGWPDVPVPLGYYEKIANCVDYAEYLAWQRENRKKKINGRTNLSMPCHNRTRTLEN